MLFYTPMCARREIEDACASKKSKLSDGVSPLWYESLLTDVQRMIHLVVIGQSNTQAQMILDEACQTADEVCQIAEMLDSNAAIAMGSFCLNIASGNEASILVANMKLEFPSDFSLRVICRCLRYSLLLLEKALNLECYVAVEGASDTPFYWRTDCDDQDRRLIIVSRDWCYVLVILFDSLSNSRLRERGGTWAVFRLSSVLGRDDRRLCQTRKSRIKSTTLAGICSDLKLRWRQVCVRFFIASGKRMKGPAFLGLIVLNLLDSSAVVDVVQSIELLIERRKILQLDCLSRSRLVARLADTLPMSIVYHQIFTYFL